MLRRDENTHKVNILHVFYNIYIKKTNLKLEIIYISE
jgi:hypothetical protein